MALSLYQAIIPSFRQILESITHLVDKAYAWCRANGVSPEDVIQARLAPDMLPFAYQVKSTAVHSIGAIEGVRKGVFGPDMTNPPESFDALKARISETREALAALTPEEINGFEGRDMRFEMGNFRMDFTAENFLLSFSQPNFYFHATTTYDILHMKGIEIGKRDYLGKPMLKS